MHMEDRGQADGKCLPLSLSTSFFLRQGLTVKLELPDSASSGDAPVSDPLSIRSRQC